MKRLGASLALTSLLSACMTQQAAAPIADRVATGAKTTVQPGVLSGKGAIPRGHSTTAHPMGRTAIHVVQRGDTLFNIAFQNGLDYRAMAQANGLAEPYLIYPGQRLQLRESPAPAAVKTDAGASGVSDPRASGRLRPGTSAGASSPSANGPSPAAGVTGRDSLDPDVAPEIWVWPVRGPIVTEFNAQTGAKGIDIGGRAGTPVAASAVGRVVYAGSGLRGYGKLVIIKHSTALLSAYGHHASLAVKEGDRVVAGQVIGTMGDTDADQVKLHFEIREFGKPVDPRKYLPAQG